MNFTASMLPKVFICINTIYQSVPVDEQTNTLARSSSPTMFPDEFFHLNIPLIWFLMNIIATVKANAIRYGNCGRVYRLSATQFHTYIIQNANTASTITNDMQLFKLSEKLSSFSITYCPLLVVSKVIPAPLTTTTTGTLIPRTPFTVANL